MIIMTTKMTMMDGCIMGFVKFVKNTLLSSPPSKFTFITGFWRLHYSPFFLPRWDQGFVM
jgi:hypothetical protein